MQYPQTLVLYLVLFVASVATNTKKIPLCTWLLCGLTRYELWAPGDGGDGKTAPKKGAKPRKAQPSKPEPSEASILTTADRTPIALRMGLPQVVQLDNFETFSAVCTQVVVLLIQWTASELMSRLFERPSSPFVAPLATLVAAFLTYQLLRILLRPVTTLQGRSNEAERQAVAAVMAICTLLFLVAFLVAPPWLLDVRLADGGAGLAAAFAPLQRLLGPVPASAGAAPGTAPTEWSAPPADFGDAFGAEFEGDADGLAADVQAAMDVAADGPPGLPLLFALFVSVAAGVYGGMLLLPIWRLARSVRSCLYPPRWFWRSESSVSSLSGLAALDQGVSGRAVSAAVVIAPAAAVLLWVTPVAQGLLGLTPPQALMAQGLALVTVGLVHLLAFRPVMQGYLNTGLVHWYSHKHGTVAGTSCGKDMAQSAASAFIVINNTAALTARIAAEIITPPALLALLGCLICDSVGLGRAAAELEDTDVALQNGAVMWMLTPPRQLVWATASILGLTGLFVQTCIALLTLSLFRNGVLHV